MKKYNVKVDSIAGWPEHGLLYIHDGSEVPPGVYRFDMGEIDPNAPRPIYITKYKNRVKVSKKILDKIEEAM